MSRSLKFAVFGLAALIAAAGGYTIGYLNAVETYHRSSMDVGYLRIANNINRDMMLLEDLERGREEDVVNALERWVSLRLSHLEGYRPFSDAESREVVNEAMRRVLEYDGRADRTLDLKTLGLSRDDLERFIE